MPKTKNKISARAYVGHSERMPRAHEVERCRMAVVAIEGARPLEAVYGPREFDAFVRDMRPNEIAVLPRLVTLDERPMPKGARAGATFTRRMLELSAACLYIVDAAAGLRSTDAGWFDHVEATHKSITHGRVLSSEEAKRRYKKGKKKRPPGLAKHWTTLRGTPAFERVRKHWMDPTLTAAEAIETAPSIAGDLNTASRSTWERIFGGRTTGAPRSRGT